ncbi:hypothetical protein ACTG2V_00110 [Aeromonas sp. 74A]
MGADVLHGGAGNDILFGDAVKFRSPAVGHGWQPSQPGGLG